MKIIVDYQPTIKELAELFCELGSDEMAEFFSHCREISESWPHNMGIYCQSLHVKDQAPTGSEAAKFIMDFAAPWFAHTLQYVDDHGERERT